MKINGVLTLLIVDIWEEDELSFLEDTVYAFYSLYLFNFFTSLLFYFWKFVSVTLIILFVYDRSKKDLPYNRGHRIGPCGYFSFEWYSVQRTLHISACIESGNLFSIGNMHTRALVMTIEDDDNNNEDDDGNNNYNSNKNNPWKRPREGERDATKILDADAAAAATTNAVTAYYAQIHTKRWWLSMNVFFCACACVYWCASGPNIQVSICIRILYMYIAKNVRACNALPTAMH